MPSYPTWVCIKYLNAQKRLIMHFMLVFIFRAAVSSRARHVKAPTSMQSEWQLHLPHSGLRGMLSQRRKLLQYLRRTDFDAYAGMLSKLGLKDTYAKQARPCCSWFSLVLFQERCRAMSLPHQVRVCTLAAQDRLAIRRTRGIDNQG